MSKVFAEAIFEAIKVTSEPLYQRIKALEALVGKASTTADAAQTINARLELLEREVLGARD